jgi:hypothetical protein
MNDFMNKNRILTIVLWIARIWGTISAAFLLFMVGAHIVGEGIGTFNSLSEIVQFLLFPCGVCEGLIIAWKWEGLGGFITTGSIITLYVLRPDLISAVFITVLAAPGLLFLIHWFLFRRLKSG